MGKFNRTINELKREEYELIFKGIPERNEYDLEIFKKIENILKYKNQVILYGPPGTGKTYIAREFGKFFNKKSYYLISEIIVPDAVVLTRVCPKGSILNINIVSIVVKIIISNVIAGAVNYFYSLAPIFKDTISNRNS